MKLRVLATAFLALSASFCHASEFQWNPSTSLQDFKNLAISANDYNTPINPVWVSPMLASNQMVAPQLPGAANDDLFAGKTLSIGTHQSEFELLWNDRMEDASDLAPMAMAAEPKVANVSEPATLGLLGLGLAALGLARSRRS